MRTRARRLGSSATGRTEFDVKGSDTDLLASRSDVLRGKHGGVRRGLVAVGLDLHAAGDAGDGLLAGQIGDVHEGVVEGGVDVRDAEDELALCNLGTERDGRLLLGRLDLLGGLYHPDVSDHIHRYHALQAHPSRHTRVAAGLVSVLTILKRGTSDVKCVWNGGNGGRG